MTTLAMRRYASGLVKEDRSPNSSRHRSWALADQDTGTVQLGEGQEKVNPARGQSTCTRDIVSQVTARRIAQVDKGNYVQTGRYERHRRESPGAMPSRHLCHHRGPVSALMRRLHGAPLTVEATIAPTAPRRPVGGSDHRGQLKMTSTTGDGQAARAIRECDGLLFPKPVRQGIQRSSKSAEASSNHAQLGGEKQVRPTGW